MLSVDVEENLEENLEEEEEEENVEENLEEEEEGRVHYDGYQVLRALPVSHAQLDTLHTIGECQPAK